MEESTPAESPSPHTPAIVYVPRIRTAAYWRRRCLEWCEAHDARVIAEPQTWDAVVELTRAQPRVLIVVGKPDHIPPDHLPRIVYID